MFFMPLNGLCPLAIKYPDISDTIIGKFDHPSICVTNFSLAVQLFNRQMTMHNFNIIVKSHLPSQIIWDFHKSTLF